MSLLDRVNDEHRRVRRRGGVRDLDWPVGRVATLPFDGRYGVDQSTFAPEEYGDYVATSSEVYSAATLRARLMSGVPLRLYQGFDARRREVTAGPAAALFRRPNPHWTWQRLSRMDELCMCLWGQSFWALHAPAGVPTEAWWMKPTRVEPVPDEDGYLAGFIYQGVTGERVPFRADEVVWFRYPNPLDEFAPLSPMAAARLAADTAGAMMRANRNLHSQGLQIGGLVVPATDRVSFSPEQAEELETLLERRWSGVHNAKRWAVLRYEAQFREMQVSPKDAEFVDGLSLTARQVWTAYGIPGPLLNDPTGATLANVREYQRQLWEHGLQPDAAARAADVALQVLPRFAGTGTRANPAPDHAEFDFAAVPALQESASESWDRDRQAMEVGAITINEWRARQGMPPVPWGDVYWAPVNKTPVDDPDDNPARAQAETDPEQDPDQDDEPDGGDAGDSGDGGDAGGEGEEGTGESSASRAHDRPLLLTRTQHHRVLAAAGLNGGGPSW